jgi:hypothetical protein
VAVNLTAFYQERKKVAGTSLSALKKKDILFSSARLLCILAAIGLFYVYSDTGANWNLIAGIICVILFFFLLNTHLVLRNEISRSKHFIRIQEEEEAYLRGDLSSFDTGIHFLNHDHLYAFDLDVFGEMSLYSHIDRCITTGGKRQLANSLLSDRPEGIIDEQAAVKEMSVDTDWRHEWQVRGAMAEEDEDIMSSIANWTAKSNEAGFLLNPVLLIALAAVTIGLIIYGATVDSDKILKLAGVSFFLNLFLVGKHMKVLQSETAALDKVIGSMKSYSGLLAQLESRSFESSRIQATLARLNSSGSSASENLKQLISIMERFEQMSNLLVATLFNGLFHFHLHNLRQLYAWRSAHSDVLEEWISVIHEMDALNSLGNYAFDHPQYVYPAVSESIGLSASSMGHPLLDSAVRVDNDLDMLNFKYVVLTGSNMSGKSTFLKSIGLNLVMMHAGLPCCAESLSAYPFRVISSMKAFDSLQKRESFFHAEVLRLKKVHTVLQGDRPCFVLLDEILRGTNSDDKRKGTRLFLEKIGVYQSMGVIATHDVDIAELADEDASTFEAKYFESQVSQGQLTFDYTLRPGVCVTANATELMKANGII